MAQLYTLGAMVAAQLFAAARAQPPDIRPQLQQGDLSQLNAWLTKAGWSRGSRQTVAELLLEVTGAPLEPQVFIQHLKSRYLGA